MILCRAVRTALNEAYPREPPHRSSGAGILEGTFEQAIFNSTICNHLRRAVNPSAPTIESIARQTSIHLIEGVSDPLVESLGGSCSISIWHKYSADEVSRPIDKKHEPVRTASPELRKRSDILQNFVRFKSPFALFSISFCPPLRDRTILPLLLAILRLRSDRGSSLLTASGLWEVSEAIALNRGKGMKEMGR
jgi:hypothetical protein